MMIRYKYSLLKSAFLILIWMGCCNASGHGYEPLPITQTKNHQERLRNGKHAEKNDKWLELLTDISVSLEGAGVYKGNYQAKTRREVQFDALKIKDLHIHFGLREDILFNSSPEQIDHIINYIQAGYEIFNGRIIALWDHTCHNPSRELEEKETNDIHWNELGIGFETNGMMLGHKDDGINFNASSKWLNSIHWKATLSKIWMRTENDYEWILKFGARDDIFRIGTHVFYTQTDLELIYDYRGVNFNSNLKVGDRFHLNEYACLILFLGYEHFDDWYYLDHKENIFSGGLSLEMGLGGKGDWIHPPIKKQDVSWAPDCSITGGYSNILGNERYGHGSDFTLALDLLKPRPDTLLGLNTYVGILTLPDDLNPQWIKYEIGPSLRIDLNEYYLDLVYSYSSLFGVETDRSMRDYHKLGIEITEDMWAHWDIKAGLAAYPLTSGFDYDGEVFSDLTFKLNPKGTTFYIDCLLKYLQGSVDHLGYAIESGVTLLGEKGNCNIYWRQQKDMDIFKFEEGKQVSLGIRFHF